MTVRDNKVLVRLGACIAAIGLVLVYYRVDPAQAAWVPHCPFHLLTGLNCPACGSQRALHAALHGHFAEAIRFNLFLIISLPYLAILIANIRTGQRWKFLRAAASPSVVRGYLVLVVGWWIVRNIGSI